MGDSKLKDKDMIEAKRKPGRPVSKPMPPHIPDTPEIVTRAVLAAPPNEKK